MCPRATPHSLPAQICSLSLCFLVSAFLRNAQKHTIAELKQKKGLGKRVAYMGKVSALDCRMRFPGSSAESGRLPMVVSSFVSYFDPFA